MALTSDQLNAIERHLRKENWLLNEDLIAELADHYVAGLEDRLASGMTFDTALQEIHANFGGRKGLLKMEEDYQLQQYRQMGWLEWKTVRSFVEGPRWPVTVAVFASLYWVNTYLGQSESGGSFLLVGSFFVTVSVLTNVALMIVSFYKNRHEVKAAVAQPSSAVYVVAYCLSLLLLLLNKYGLALTPTMLMGLETLLETLCFIYYIAIFLTIRRLFSTNRKQKAKIA
ncbi:hypothetical protein [Spirosoma areae]